jgi:hypothetical protein
MLGRLRTLAVVCELWRTGNTPFQGENPGSIPGGDAKQDQPKRMAPGWNCRNIRPHRLSPATRRTAQIHGDAFQAVAVAICPPARELPR